MTTIDEKKLTDLFVSFDKNGDGTLSKDEIEEGYDALGIPIPVGLSELMKKLDNDGDGSISYRDFLIETQDLSTITHKKELEFMFKIHNDASDGILSIEELKKAIPGIEDSEWDEFLSAADTNKDGLISLDELKAYLIYKLNS